MRVYAIGPDGKKAHTRPFHGTYSQGKKALAAFRAELEASGETPGNITYDGYMAVFLEWYSGSGREPSTVEKARYNLAALSPHLGGMAMRDVSPADIERAYSLLRSGETPSGRPYAETTLATVNATAHQMFKRAKRDGVVDEDPFACMAAPRPDTPEKKALTTGQAVALLSSLEPSRPEECIVALMLTAGLRRSEAVRVRRCDVLDGVLRVWKSKTRAGVRSVPLEPNALGAIAARMDAQEREFARMGVPLADDEFLCSSPLRKGMTPHAVTRWWERNRSRFGLDGWTPHELRHSFLTLLAEAGAPPKVMQELAGHESPITTLRIYTHVHDEQKREAMGSLGGLLGSPAGHGNAPRTHEGACPGMETKDRPRQDMPEHPPS